MPFKIVPLSFNPTISRNRNNFKFLTKKITSGKGNIITGSKIEITAHPYLTLSFFYKTFNEK